MRVLGFANPAMYAGDLTIQNGIIKDVTNLSGAFQFDDPHGLLEVADALDGIGLRCEKGAVRFFPMDGSTPRILR